MSFLMQSLMVIGAVNFALAVMMLLPNARRRAEARGKIWPLKVPVIHACLGFAVFMVGAIAG